MTRPRLDLPAEEIAALFKRCRIRKMPVFGAVLTDEPKHSDVT